MTPNDADPVHVRPPGDGLDRLLSDFFTNEMPRPWPGPRAVGAAEPSTLARGRADSGHRSRYTLAASVAGLVGLGVLLSAGVPAGRPEVAPMGLPKAAEADGGKLLPKAISPMPDGRDPMLIPNMP